MPTYSGNVVSSDVNFASLLIRSVSRSDIVIQGRTTIKAKDKVERQSCERIKDRRF